jgi:hypothetical protein
MPVVKYRSFNPGLRPRRTKMDMPGWGGLAQPRNDGSHEQPWHGAPFPKARNTESKFSIHTKMNCALRRKVERYSSPETSGPHRTTTCSGRRFVPLKNIYTHISSCSISKFRQAGL